jgi:hypothetical protein
MWEDAAQKADGIEFAPSRESNSKRGDDAWRSGYKRLMRKRIEIVFSQITNLLPKHIHAVTRDGFLLKVSMSSSLSLSTRRSSSNLG